MGQATPAAGRPLPVLAAGGRPGGVVIPATTQQTSGCNPVLNRLARQRGATNTGLLIIAELPSGLCRVSHNQASCQSSVLGDCVAVDLGQQCLDRKCCDCTVILCHRG